MATTMATREAYGKALVELGLEDSRIVVLGGDLNVSTNVNLFAKEFPDRFFDLGIAEQNIMSMAAGLAASGKIVFASTFAVFGTGRAFDQIRVGIAQPHLNVKIVVTHAGILTGEDGVSAQAIEDLSLMCSLPGLNVIVPSDGPEAAQAARLAARTEGPFYIRLSRPATPVMHHEDFDFRLGHTEVMRPGKDVSVVACGVMVNAALEAANELAQEGVDCRVLNMATLMPTDEEALVKAAMETGALVTAEEHYIHGGLNSIVAQVVTRYCPVPIEPVALLGYAESGHPDQLLQKYHLTSEDVAAATRRVLTRKG